MNLECAAEKYFNKSFRLRVSSTVNFTNLLEPGRIATGKTVELAEPRYEA